MKLCITCNNKPARPRYKHCAACMNRDYRARKKAGLVNPKPRRPREVFQPGDDLFRNELIGALLKMQDSTLPLISDGMTT